MDKKNAINELIKKKVVILDGSNGVLLQSRGMPAGVCPEAWGIDNPDELSRVHAEYVKAGADIIYTFTFGGSRPKLKQYGITDVYNTNKKLAEIARNAIGNDAFLAGDIAPTGLFVEPFGSLLFEDAVDIFKEQARGLIDGGVDLFVIETMMDIQEARAALIAVKELTDAFTVVTMTFEPGGKTLGGTDPVTALITLQALGADAVGCNCSSGPEQMLPIISMMKPFAKVPLVAKPNAGLPKLVDGKTVFDMDAFEFGSFGSAFTEAGINMLGGCCGTTPAHIRAVAEAEKDTVPRLPFIDAISGLSSARSHIILDNEKPVAVIGERINPTGKKMLQAELKQGSLSMVRQFAREQNDAGADLLDVNVGVPGIDEPATMKSVIGLLSSITDLPLVIDSSKSEAIEAALRLYPGRALINSISGEESKIEALLPVAAKYGAMFILLPLTDSGIPRTLEDRRAVIESIFDKARSLGFTKEDIIVDALTMTVSAEQDAPKVTLDTIEWCTNVFHVRTLLGLSNVSFGLPERRWINASFLAMAVSRGLSVAIANPSSEELMAMKLASDVLAGRDKGARSYISRYAAFKSSVPEKTGILSPSRQVARAILDGDRDDIAKIIEKALSAGTDAGSLVNDIMIPAIRQVGDLYEKGTYFLPQLIASAETMQKGFAVLEPMLDQASSARKGRVLMATVKGDIHDIGKNIVVLLLRNNGFEVIDLGKDVSNETIIKAINEYRPDIVGLSALMTTTMTIMKEVITLARERGIICPFMVGGAVVTAEYAASINAAYAKDGVEAVRVAEGLIRQVTSS
jgi:5-methyltetrahydrofolate--homocysteine methyltransferase